MEDLERCHRDKKNTHTWDGKVLYYKNSLASILQEEVQWEDTQIHSGCVGKNNPKPAVLSFFIFKDFVESKNFKRLDIDC